VLPSLKLTTEYNWELVGAKESHIVLTRQQSGFEFKLLKECELGDTVVLHSPNLWPKNCYALNNTDNDSTIVFTPELAKYINNEEYVPDIVLRSPKCVVESYLAETFGGKSPFEFGSYSARSKLKIEQIRLLLLNLGILTSLQVSDDEYLLTQEPVDRTTDGYFFVKIKDIQDGPDLHMMDVHIPETNVYTADGFVHHNSGKSAITGILASYHLHRFYIFQTQLLILIS
jgi:hypothetical protein